MKQLLQAIQSVFSQEKALARRATKAAALVNSEFAKVEALITKGDFIMEDRDKAINDRIEFLADNSELTVDQNVGRTTDNKRAMRLLVAVIVLGFILAVSGIQFILGERYGVDILWLAVLISFIAIFSFVQFSIYMNHFAKQIMITNQILGWIALIGSYVAVLMVPALNLVETFSSDYNQWAMVGTLILCATDIYLHAVLVTMSSTFVTAENSMKAIKLLKQKDHTLRAKDQQVRNQSNSFVRYKRSFVAAATVFVQAYRRLVNQNGQAAADALLLMPNFTIWMINNRVYQHVMLPYHSNESGTPVIDYRYFTENEDTIRMVWDQLSVRRQFNNRSNQARINQSEGGANEGSPPLGSAPVNGYESRQEQNEHRSHVHDQEGHQTVDFDIEDEFSTPNPNDKFI